MTLVYGCSRFVSCSVRAATSASISARSNPNSMRRSMSLWALGSELQAVYIVELLCPQVNEIRNSTKKLSIFEQEQIMKKHREKRLRELAREYNVSHETLRRTISKVPDF